MVRVSEAPAAEFFEAVARAAADRERWAACIESGGESEDCGNASQGGRSAPVSDPVAGAALGHLRAVERAREGLRAASAMVEEGEAVIAGVSSWLGADYGAVLELRYVDRLAWAAVGAECGLSESTCLRHRAVALDYVDAVGTQRAKQGAAP